MELPLLDKGFTSCCVGCSWWLFFQNVTQVQLHGGKNPIVLFQEMKLQFELHVGIEPVAAPCNGSTGQVPLPEHEISQGTPRICVPPESFMFQEGDLTS